MASGQPLKQPGGADPGDPEAAPLLGSNGPAAPPPPPQQQQQQQQQQQLLLLQQQGLRWQQPAAVICWMVLSTAMIFCNRAILKVYAFRHPLYLTWAQQTGTAALLWCYYKLTPSRPHPASSLAGGEYFQRIVPIAAMLCASIVLRNYVYLYLSVAAMQMLAAAAPALVFLIAAAMGEEALSAQLGAAILAVCTGVGLFVAGGPVAAAWQGVALQVVAIVLEGVRAVLLKRLMTSHRAKIDPLDMLGLLAPASAALLYVPAAAVDFEGVFHFTRANGWAVHGAVAGNVALALALNFSALWMLREVAVLTASLSGVLKDCCIIWLSILVGDHKALAPANAAGWALSVAGLLRYAWLRSGRGKPRAGGGG